MKILSCYLAGIGIGVLLGAIGVPFWAGFLIGLGLLYVVFADEEI